MSECVLYSPCTVTRAVAPDAPYSLLATHSYSPSSDGATGEISRAPVAVVVNLPESRGTESVLLHVMVDVG